MRSSGDGLSASRFLALFMDAIGLIKTLAFCFLESHSLDYVLLMLQQSHGYIPRQAAWGEKNGRPSSKLYLFRLYLNKA